VTPGGLDLECLQSQVVAAGKTWASGKWFRQDVYSEYFPVFCGPDFSGYGSGYYQLEDGLLFVEAQNGPFQFDEEGNSTFYRKGKYLPNQNTGAFEGAIGWEITIIQTLAEDNPENDPQGLGYSTSISFGWVYI
jgi:hypothetical protein